MCNSLSEVELRIQWGHEDYPVKIWDDNRSTEYPP